MSAVSHLVGAAFGAASLIFAEHELDRQSAVAYLDAAVKAQIAWTDAEQDIRDYLQVKGCPQSFVDRQVARARPLLEPWL